MTGFFVFYRAAVFVVVTAFLSGFLRVLRASWLKPAWAEVSKTNPSIPASLPSP
jgi:hypothetical protein